MKKHPRIKSLMDSQAGGLLVLSLVMFIMFLAILVYGFYKDPVLGHTLLGAFIAHTLGGRAAGVGLCVAFKMDMGVNILYNMFLEMLIVCISYSLFSLSMTHYVKNRWIQNALLNAEKNALRYQDDLARYGWMGVFVFVMIPLPVTGPVVGSIIAYFLNFNLKQMFLSVFCGTFIAIVIWTLFFDFLSSHLSTIQWVMAIPGIVVMVYFAKHIRNWFSKDIDDAAEGVVEDKEGE